MSSEFSTDGTFSFASAEEGGGEKTKEKKEEEEEAHEEGESSKNYEKKIIIVIGTIRIVTVCHLSSRAILWTTCSDHCPVGFICILHALTNVLLALFASAPTKKCMRKLISVHRI